MAEEETAAKIEIGAENPPPVEPNKANYGLFKLKKTIAGSKLARPAVFSAVDDSEEIFGESSGARPQIDVTRKSRKADEVAAARALVEDPSVFSYDEIFEKMQKEKETKTAEIKKADKERRPKYIETMVETAKRRQRDFESHLERMQQKERIKEGDAFADKEIFVTANYRKKMEEIAKFEAEERMRERLEEISDVSKQKDFAFTGFYQKYLDDQTRTTPAAGPEIKEEPKESEPADEPPEPSAKPIKPEKSYRSRKRSEAESPSPIRNGNEEEKKKNSRRFASSNSDSDENPPRIEKEIEPTQLKAGLNYVRKKKSPSPPPRDRGGRRRSRSRSRSRDRRIRRRSRSRSTSRDRRSHRDRDRKDEKRDIKRRRSRSRSKSPAVAENRTKNKNEAAPSKKKLDAVEEKLQKWREIFKRRNALEQIQTYRQRFFERLAEKN